MNADLSFWFKCLIYCDQMVLTSVTNEYIFHIWHKMPHIKVKGSFCLCILGVLKNDFPDIFSIFETLSWQGHLKVKLWPLKVWWHWLWHQSWSWTSQYVTMVISENQKCDLEWTFTACSFLFIFYHLNRIYAKWSMALYG